MLAAGSCQPLNEQSNLGNEYPSPKKANQLNYVGLYKPQKVAGYLQLLSQYARCYTLNIRQTSTSLNPEMQRL